MNKSLEDLIKERNDIDEKIAQEMSKGHADAVKLVREKIIHYGIKLTEIKSAFAKTSNKKSTASVKNKTSTGKRGRPKKIAVTPEHKDGSLI